MTEIKNITEDVSVFSTQTTSSGDNVSLIVGDLTGTPYETLIKLPTPTDPNTNSAKLVLKRYSANRSGTFDVYTADSTWSETTRWSNRPTKTFVKTVSDPGGAIGSAFEVDISDIYNAAHGVVFATTGPYIAYWSSEHTTTANRPTVVYETVSVATPGGYSPTPMLGSASMPGGSVPSPRTVNAQPMIASADMPGGRYAIWRAVPVDTDTYTDAGSTNTVFGQDPALQVGPLKTIYVKPPTLNLEAGETWTGEARLGLKPSGTVGAASWTLGRVSATWSENTLTASNAPSGGFVRGVSYPGSGNLTIPIGDILADGHSVSLSGSASGTFHSSEATVVSNRPYVEYLVLPAPAASVTIPAQPLVGETSMPTATTGVGAVLDVEAMAGTADMPNAIVIGERYYTHDAESMDAYAETPNGLFALPVTVNADVLNVDASVLDPTTETATGVIYVAEPVTATASIIRPALVNDEVIVIDESDDKYFQRVFNLAPKVFQRLNDKGSTALDRMGTYNGVYHGVQVGKFAAPDGRHSVHFPVGTYLEQNEPTGTNADEATIQDGSALASTLEFSFRTSKGDTFLMAGADSSVTSRGVVSAYAARELILKGGKLTFRSRIFAGTPDAVEKEFTGVRDLSDGKWHHVVVRSGVYSRGQWATELWIDGTFEIRRFDTNGFFGFPDFIGWRPNLIDGSELETLPLSQSFEGDMSEVAFYGHANLGTHDIARNYYAFMGWAPITPASMEASATMGDGRGKGSQKKALYLYWNPTDEVFLTGDAPEYSLSFDPMPGFVERATNAPNLPFTNHERVGDYHGLKVFSRSVRSSTNDTSYRDPLTDDQSLINLETDIDLDDYDVIMFKDWPDEGPELDDIEYNYPGQKERLIRQLRDANDRGVGLMVTNPRMAVDLGVIDRVEYVPSLKETRYNNNQGAAFGLYDYGSAVKFPWNIVASDNLSGGDYAAGIGQTQDMSASTLENKAFFYHDTNANNRFRVRAAIDGLTDIPGWMIADAVWHVDYDQYGWQGAAYKYLKRDAGLLIGDEYIFYGSEVINAKSLDAAERRYNRFNGTWAVPNGHVKAGTIVTTFGSKHWVDKSLVDNPYRDYATTIVLNQGDVLAGRPVGGRIFVNFTEQPSNGLGVAVQEIPSGNTGWPALYPVETSAQREWDYSWTRTTLKSTQGQSASPYVMVTMPNGQVVGIKVGGAEPNNLAMVRSNQLFPVSGKPRMEMTARGIYWLSDSTKPEEGAVSVRATAMNTTGVMPEPTVTGRKTAGFRAQPMLATSSMPRVEEDTFGDVNIRPLPFTVGATFTGYGKTIGVEPFEATAEIVEPFDAVHAEGEQVALILHNYEATLYLKEEA